MNVVFVLLDTLRRDHLGCYGSRHARTPNIDGLAEMGTVFEQSYMGSYPCMPARQDFWTGHLNFLWRGWSPLEYAEDDLVSALNRAGKPTMLVTDHYHLWSYGSGNYHMSFYGTEFVRGQELDNWVTDPNVPIRHPARPSKLHHRWERYARNTAHFRREEDYFAPRVFARAADWINRNHSLEDFFLTIDCFDPHEPFDPPQRYVDLYDPGYEGESAIWPRYGHPQDHGYSAEELEHIHALYCGEVSMVDAWLGVLLDCIEAKGLLENTMIILTSDHGFMFGEHDWLGKHSPTLYQHITHTPLIVYHPEQARPGRRVSDIVQMADLNPTVAEVLGLRAAAGSHGQSLMTAVRGERRREPKQAAFFGAFGGPVYVADGDWVYVKRPVPENAPLYWYTRSHFNQWDFGGNNDIQESRRRLEHYKDGRFPTDFKGASIHHGGPRPILADKDDPAPEDSRADELYRISLDYEQKANVADHHPQTVKRLRGMLGGFLRDVEAPEEQFERLGL